MLVSASAGSGKTYIMIKYLSKLICEDKVPIKDFLVLTFTKAAANEMKERLEKKLKEYGDSKYVIEQLDALSTSNISTIHSFCEKCIKKYANLLNLSENFTIADENMSQKIRQNAFELALKEFQKEFEKDYQSLIATYKNDRNKIKEIIFEIEKLVNSIADKEDFILKNTQESEVYFERALKFLYNSFMTELNNCLAEIESLHAESFLFELKTKLLPILTSKNLFEVAKGLDNFSFPYLPKRKDAGDELVEKLSAIKKSINKIIEKIRNLNLNDKKNIDFQKTGRQEKIILKLYENYEKIQKKLKKSQNYLDFYDLEKYMKILSLQENLFSGIKYVFVDEYQDTNKIQEKIIKNIAKNSNFVAVGDAKQGIYGFRLASAEIFLNDIKNFEQDENSSVNYLQSNFRSSQKVLDFINNVFSKCMTNETVGIDYSKDSMLVGRSNFIDDGHKSINIDIISPAKPTESHLPKIYSVKEADVIVENKKDKLLLDIKRQIINCLSSKISVDGQLRQVKYADIAILSRKRDDFFNQLESFLQENDIPVVANSKNLLLENPYMQILLNYLKLALNLDDEVALVSVLLSPLYNFNLEDLLNEKLDNDFSLCEIVKTDKNKNFIKFNENLADFRLNLQIFGINNAFLTLFNKTNFISHLNLLPNHKQLNSLLDKFLEEILQSGYNFDLPNLISYFENVEITVTNELSTAEDCLLLSTIHNSKGLEYPIVFLIGCDQSLKKSLPKTEVQINEDFGLAVKYFDAQNNLESQTVRMLAIKESERQKDFAEELMIFYVALTRAKNRLYLFGEEKKFDRQRLQDCDSYFDLIFYALQKEKDVFVEQNHYEDANLEISYIEEIKQAEFGNQQDFENAQVDKNFVQQLEAYLDFKYDLDEKSNFSLKESVTSINQKTQEDVLEKFSTDSFNFAGQGIEIGNAYHLALKIIDFNKVHDASSLEKEIEINEIDVSLIDKDILLQNILILKNIIAGADKVVKEKEFIMKTKICEVVGNTNLQDKIMIQGVIDLFVVKNNSIILVDYKYSNSKNEKYLIKKYAQQIKAYKLALEKALNMSVLESFLLSLKEKKLIKIN